MRWIICFCESPNTGFWKLFTRNKPQFSHVFAVRYIVESDKWIRVEYATQGFNFNVYTEDEADYLVAFLIEKCVCIDYTPQKQQIFMPRLMYCVSFMKHLCNIHDFFILTPYQLHCELLKRGGKVIFTKEGEPNGIYETTKTSARPRVGKAKRSRKAKGRSFALC